MVMSYSEFEPPAAEPRQRIELNKQKILLAGRKRRRHQWLSMAFVLLCIALGGYLLIDRNWFDFDGVLPATGLFTEEKTDKTTPASPKKEESIIQTLISDTGDKFEELLAPKEESPPPAQAAAPAKSTAYTAPAPRASAPANRSASDSTECCVGCNRPLGGPGRAGVRTGPSRSGEDGQNCP